MKLFNQVNRRMFVQTTGAALMAATVIPAWARGPKPKTGNSDTLKVGLIGCGGRGSGAALQATKADPNVILYAMADLFEDRLNESLENLQKENPDKIKVAHKFVGFDAYARLLETDVDVVILASPPVFRPLHVEAAVAAGKHMFVEKPVAVDAPGIRRIYAAARKAKEKNLGWTSGFCWRFDYRKRDTFGRVLDGAIGDVQSVYNTYNTGALWYRGEGGYTGNALKMRNWLYYNFMSGDHIVEQAVHSVDMMSWAMGDKLPLKVTATGGRQSRTEERYGNVYDHFAVVYEYANGAKGYHFSRQQEGCSRAYGIEMIGSKGRCEIEVGNRHEIIGAKKNWKWEGKANDMYQTEHDELFASIRAGKQICQGEAMAQSSMLAIWGRMAAYTGQTLTWDQALNSQEQLGPSPEDYHWDMIWPEIPVAQPGITKFV